MKPSCVLFEEKNPKKIPLFYHNHSNVLVTDTPGMQFPYYMALIIITYNTILSFSSDIIFFIVGKFCSPFNNESQNLIINKNECPLKHIIALKAYLYEFFSIHIA